MGDLRIDSFGLPDSQAGQPKDGSKKRSRERHTEPPEEPIDEVTLSSASEPDAEPLGYKPPKPRVPEP